MFAIQMNDGYTITDCIKNLRIISTLSLTPRILKQIADTSHQLRDSCLPSYKFKIFLKRIRCITKMLGSWMTEIGNLIMPLTLTGIAMMLVATYEL